MHLTYQVIYNIDAERAGTVKLWLVMADVVDGKSMHHSISIIGHADTIDGVDSMLLENEPPLARSSGWTIDDMSTRRFYWAHAEITNVKGDGK